MSPATGDTASAESKAGLSGQVRRAIFWRTGTQILSQIISWTVTLIVIRILNPADYGLYAMAQVMMTFLDFLNGYGFASALILIGVALIMAWESVARLLAPTPCLEPCRPRELRAIRWNRCRH